MMLKTTGQGRRQMFQLANQPNFPPTASQGYGFPSFGPNYNQGLTPQMGGNSQLAMMGSMMSMLMSAMQQMMQGLMGMNGGANSMVPMTNFGGQPGSSNGLSDFLGGGSTPSSSSPAAGSSVASSAAPASTSGSSTPAASSGSATSADLPQGAAGLTFAKAAELVKKGGGEVNPGGKPTVLALRSKTSASATYQDTFVVLKPDGTLQHFSANTRPTTAGKDKAMLKPGAYDISPRWRDGKFNNDAFLVKAKGGSTTVGVGRDSNGDGQYSEQEMNANTSSSLIRLHRGRGDRTSSSGCLNVKDYDGFLQAVGGRDASFNLVLVNLN